MLALYFADSDNDSMASALRDFLLEHGLGLWVDHIMRTHGVQSLGTLRIVNLPSLQLPVWDLETLGRALAGVPETFTMQRVIIPWKDLTTVNDYTTFVNKEQLEVYRAHSKATQTI